jgi:NAD(P)-dependent dehydrogenase (short-subunit alcohol dehydrogenase family)
MSSELAAVLITGGTSGTGRATAQLFSDRDEARAYLAGEDARPVTGIVLAVGAGRATTL